MIVLNMIAAVGRRGQLGLDGKIPWRSPRDQQLFRAITEGGVLIVGHRTWETVQHLHGTNGRLIVLADRSDAADPAQCLERLYRSHGRDRKFWLAGGAATYRAFAPFVTGSCIVSFVDYDGEADAWFPFDAFGILK